MRGISAERLENKEVENKKPIRIFLRPDIKDLLQVVICIWVIIGIQLTTYVNLNASKYPGAKGIVHLALFSGDNPLFYYIETMSTSAMVALMIITIIRACTHRILIDDDNITEMRAWIVMETISLNLILTLELRLWYGGIKHRGNKWIIEYEPSKKFVDNTAKKSYVLYANGLVFPHKATIQFKSKEDAMEVVNRIMKSGRDVKFTDRTI